MGVNARVALEKFARYFEVKPRILDVTERSEFCLDPGLVKQNLDGNTISVFCYFERYIHRTLRTCGGNANILDDFQNKTGHDVPLMSTWQAGFYYTIYICGHTTEIVIFPSIPPTGEPLPCCLLGTLN
jgi:glutamate decarboxylase